MQMKGRSSERLSMTGSYLEVGQRQRTCSEEVYTGYECKSGILAPPRSYAASIRLTDTDRPSAGKHQTVTRFGPATCDSRLFSNRSRRARLHRSVWEAATVSTPSALSAAAKFLWLTMVHGC